MSARMTTVSDQVVEDNSKTSDFHYISSATHLMDMQDAEEVPKVRVHLFKKKDKSRSKKDYQLASSGSEAVSDDEDVVESLLDEVSAGDLELALKKRSSPRCSGYCRKTMIGSVVFLLVVVIVTVVLTILRNTSNGIHQELTTSYEVIPSAEASSSILSKTIVQKEITSTECGPVKGKRDKLGVVTFRGIPYALPPIKSRRWKNPQLLTPKRGCWRGTYQAIRNKRPCYQLPFGYPFHMGTEDCLYLNVFTPTLDPEAKLPVMVYIHGGYLQFGFAVNPIDGPGAKLAKSLNMVFVSISYRLNAFGFMALEVLSENSPTNSSGNYGLMDQITSLEWIQRNIRNFGGDPELVTIYGQSSGATTAFGMLASPLTKGLFHRAWLMSGSVKLQKTLKQAERENIPFLRNTKCISSPSPVKCLYNLTAAEVVKAIPWTEYPSWRAEELTDVPEKNDFSGAVIIVDGKIVPQSPVDAWNSGIKTDVPLLIGTAAQEAEFGPTPSDEIYGWNWTDYDNYVKKKLDTFSPEISEQALRFYNHTENPVYQFSSLVSDVRATCPNDVVAEKAAIAFESPVYRYVVTMRPTNKTDVFGSGHKLQYSFHGLDGIAFSGRLSTFLPIHHTEKAFTKLLQNAVVEFAKTGKISTWKEFPEATALISSDITFRDRYCREKCLFWTRNGFYPDYAWIN